ncbi:MAG: hypothetical protein ACFFCI_00535 [Promethearchaeota archaeon]
MSQVLGLSTGGLILLLLGLVGLLMLSVVNPQLRASIDAGEEQGIVIERYASFWADLIFLIAATGAWGIKAVGYGISLLFELGGKTPALIEAIMSGNLIAFIAVLADWQNFLNAVTGYLGELVNNFLMRLANVIPPGQAAKLLERIVAW